MRYMQTYKTLDTICSWDKAGHLQTITHFRQISEGLALSSHPSAHALQAFTPSTYAFPTGLNTISLTPCPNGEDTLSLTLIHFPRSSHSLELCFGPTHSLTRSSELQPFLSQSLPRCKAPAIPFSLPFSLPPPSPPSPTNIFGPHSEPGATSNKYTRTTAAVVLFQAPPTQDNF